MSESLALAVHNHIMVGGSAEAGKIIDGLASSRGDSAAMDVVRSLNRDDIYLLCRNYDESHDAVVMGLLSHTQKHLFLNDMYAMAMRKIMDGKGDSATYYNDFISVAFSLIFSGNPSVEDAQSFLDNLDEEVDATDHVDLVSMYDYGAALLATSWDKIISFIQSESGAHMGNESPLAHEYVKNPEILADFVMEWVNEVNSTDHYLESYDDPFIACFAACVKDVDPRDLLSMCEISMRILDGILFRDAI